jgi:hypothetical protein
MEMTPDVLPSKLPEEKVAVYVQLEAAIAPATIIANPVFESEPAGLIFSDESRIDSDRTAVAFVTGGDVGTVYAVTATCQLSNGEIIQPVVALPVVSAIAQTTRTRPQVL